MNEKSSKIENKLYILIDILMLILIFLLMIQSINDVEKFGIFFNIYVAAYSFLTIIELLFFNKNVFDNVKHCIKTAKTSTSFSLTAIAYYIGLDKYNFEITVVLFLICSIVEILTSFNKK